MGNIAWEMTHTVETSATRAFAWKYWTTVSNWADPPAEFEFQGPFQAGSRGVTRLPGQAPIEWFLQRVYPPTTATIAMPLSGALLFFEWRFDDRPDGRTRISQRIVLEGEKADSYRTQVASTFAASIPDGMNKIARAMTEARARKTDAHL